MTVSTTMEVMKLVQMLSEHATKLVELCPGGEASEVDGVETGGVPASVTLASGLNVEGGTAAGGVVLVNFEASLTMLELAALLVKLSLPEAAATELAESDDSTLKTELVAVKEPVVICEVVAATDIVGVVDLPWAPLKAVPTEELVFIAGVTLDSEDEDGRVPETRWYTLR